MRHIFKLLMIWDKLFFKKLIRILKNPDMDVDVETLVFDRYDIEPSLNIKGNERQRRGDSNPSTASHKIIGNRKVPNYKQFLTCGQNKASLIYFLSQYLEAKVPDVIAHDRTLVIAGGYPNPQMVKELSTAATREVEALASSHAEADTKWFCMLYT